MRDLVLGKDRVWKKDHVFPSSLRIRHLYTLGKTGVGKSTFFHRLIHQDAKKEYATILFDAGDLATDVFETLPDRLMSRVNFFTIDRPIPYNPLLRRRPKSDLEREEIAAVIENELFALMDQVVAEGSSTAPLSARMKRVLSVALREVLKQPEPTLATLATYLLTKGELLGRALHIHGGELSNTIDAVLDRVSPFLRDPRIRRVLCAPHTLDFGRFIDRGDIFLISLSGLEPALKRFIGTLLFTGLQQTILERAKADRRPVAVYVDEFHDYIASTLAAQKFQVLFSQGRKYRLSLSVAHTDFGQVPRPLLNTMTSTVGSAVTFSCGPPEAQAMSRLFGAQAYPPEMLSFLPDHVAVARTGNLVRQFETYPAPSRLREIMPDTSPLPPTPPDPFDVVIEGDVKRDPYVTARKPRARAN